MLKLKGLELLFPNHDVLGSSRWFFGSGTNLLPKSPGLGIKLTYLPPWTARMYDRFVYRHYNLSIWVELTSNLIWSFCLLGGETRKSGKVPQADQRCPMGWIFFRIREVGILTTLAEAGHWRPSFLFDFGGCFFVYGRLTAANGREG